MCHFHYKKFDSCGDYGIEISHVCDEALWRAGLRGVLQICVPRILERSLEWSGRDDHEPPKPALFRGYDGFCEMCVARFMLPDTIQRRSYSDHELDYTPSWNSFNPDDLAPYFSFGGLTSQIPQLLGLSDQFNAAYLKQGPLMIFQKSLIQGTWSELRKSLPFTYQGAFQIDCTLDLEETMTRLNLKEGITMWDSNQVAHAIQHGPHPRVVYNHLFKHRGMPLGHFTISIVKSCQQAVLQLQAETAAAVSKSLKQNKESSDDSTLTELTNTPVLSDMEIPASRTPAQGSDLSGSPKYDGSVSTPRRIRELQALQNSPTKKQATVIRFAPLTDSPPQYNKASPKLLPEASGSMPRGLVKGSSPGDLKQEEMGVEPTPRYLFRNGRRVSRAPFHVPEDEKQGTAEKAERPRRMAIAEQEFEGMRLRHLVQGSGSTNTLKPTLTKPCQGDESGQKSQKLQHLKDLTLEDGNGPSASVPYYGAAREFKWKVLERPGYKQTPNASSPTSGSRGRNARGRRGCQQPMGSGDPKAQVAQHLPTQDALVIPDETDMRREEGEVGEEEAGQSTTQPETNLDPPTVRRLQDSGLLGRSRRR